MKKSDIAMVVLIASVSILVSFFATQALFGGAANESITVKTVEKIDATIVEPDTAIFNENAINPAVEVQVGSGSQ
jgi:thiamine biosynthesis lipoprotein ApbE